MPKPKRREVKAALNDIDDNKDGKLSFEELKPVIMQFVKAMINRDNTVQEETIEDVIQDKEKIEKIAKTLFKQVDKSGTGEIGKEDLKAFMMKVSQQIGYALPTDKQVECKLKKLDLNKDGTLNFNEFKPYFIKVIKRLDNLDRLKKRVLYNNLSIDNLDETVQKVFNEAD